MKITTAWRDGIAESRFDDDPAQLAVVRELQELQDWLEEQRGFVERVRHLFTPSIRTAQRRGIYLWGGVGRGKTFLMDLFFETLARSDKRRVHFHRFMSEVHDRLRDIRETDKAGNPLDGVAADLAQEAAILCFDEFFVSDIAAGGCRSNSGARSAAWSKCSHPTTCTRLICRRLGVCAVETDEARVAHFESRFPIVRGA
jgi:predicted ATPase